MRTILLLAGDKAMRIKQLLFMLLLVFLAVPASAANIYVAQVSAGGNTGADCADARTIASLAAGDWIAGNVLHLCGTISSGFSVQGSGSSGNVITVKWEASARVSVAHGGIINVGAYNYLLFDGGIACGPNTACATVEAANLTGYSAGQ